MKRIVYSVLILLLLAVIASPVLASDVTDARYHGTIRITNTGTAATGVSTNVTIDSASLVSEGYCAADYSDIGVLNNGTDTAFQPGYGTNAWAVWVGSMEADTNVDYDFYTGNVTGGKIRWFPGTTGGETADSATFEPGGNFLYTYEGYLTATLGAGRSMLRDKAQAYYVGMIDDGEIAGGIYSSNVSPDTVTDPDSAWTNDNNAKDGNTGTYAEMNVTQATWTNFLEFNLSDEKAISAVRYYVSGAVAITQIDIDLYYNSTWNDFYSGAAGAAAWATKDLTTTTVVSKARSRLQHNTAGSQTVYYCDFQFGAFYDVSMAVTTAEHDITFGNRPCLDYVDTNSDYTGFGDSDLWSFTDGAGTDEAFTIIMQVNLDDATSGAFFAKEAAGQREYACVTTAADAINFSLVNPDASAFIERDTGAITAYEGSYTHFSFTYSGSEATTGLHIYANGANIDAGTPSGGAYTGMTNGTAAFEVGRATLYSTFLDGKGGYVKVYNRELSAAEVLADYNGTHSTTNLTAFYRLDEGTGLPQDATSNNLDALTNAADWSTNGIGLAVDSVWTYPITATVPNTATSTYDALNAACPYVEHITTVISGTLQQDIDWEYAATFNDASAGNHDMTPSFRTTSSDSDVSASLISFSPTTEAEVPTFVIVENAGIITDNVTAAAQLFTELDFTHIMGAEAANEILDAGGVPRTLWWFPVLFITIAIIGMMIYDATTRRLNKGRISQDSDSQGSLLAMCIVIEVLLGVFGIMNPIPLWPAFLFPIPAIAYILSKKHYSWG